MTRTLTLEGVGTAVDTNVPLTVQGEDGSVSRAVPKGSRIVQDIVAAIIADGLADGSGGFILKLSEGGIRGTQKITIGGQGAKAVQSGADANSPAALVVLEDVDIPVEEAKDISVAVEMVGSDLGDVSAMVTLIFD